MLTVADALAVVLAHARPLPPEAAPLGPALLGAVLAEDVASDLDMPPYDKSMMDGYAVRAADLPGGRGELAVIEEVMAGRTPHLAVGEKQATRVMTGAPMPAGTDAVVMVERTRQADGDRVHIDDPGLQPGRNIVTRGREMRRGDVVLRAGAVLRPQEFGLLAAVGRTTAAVVPWPRVAVLPTGDEVVEPAETPGPAQIRNSNGPMLLAQVVRAGGRPHALGVARDRLDSLRPLVAEGLDYDVLLLSGGVSAGKLDLTPGVLQEAGVVAHFHKIEMKPGKPLLFGTRERLPPPQPSPRGGGGQGGGPTLVFGLPGNPVSTFVCFELFVRPALRRLRGLADADAPLISAVLTEDFTYRTDRPTYHPARLEVGEDGWRVRAVPWFGSADLRGLLDMDALMVLPAGDHRHTAGTRLPVARLEY